MSRARFIAGLTTPNWPMTTAINSICRRHGVQKWELMLSGKRSARISHARQEAYYVLYQIVKSKRKVARIMGKDRSTIGHGIKAHLDRLEYWKSRSEGKEIA